MDQDQAALLNQVTVLTVTYNSSHCVPALAEGLRGVPHVIVVDNASGDDSCAAVSAALPRATIIRMPRNQGYGVANNAGLAQVTTPYALLLNPDCLVTPAQIAALVAHAQEWPDATIVAPQLLESSGERQLNYSWPRDDWAPRTGGAEGPLNVGYACAAVMLLNMQQLGMLTAEGVDSENAPQRGQFLTDSQAHSPAMGQEAGEKWTDAAHLQPTSLLPPRLLTHTGAFDPRFFLYYEDEDLCLRIFKRHGQIIVVPDVQVTHLSRGSVKGKTPLRSEYWRGFHHAQSKIIFIDKHAGRTKALQARRRLMTSSCANVLVRTILISPKHLARAFGRLRGVWQLQL